MMSYTFHHLAKIGSRSRCGNVLSFLDLEFKVGLSGEGSGHRMTLVRHLRKSRRLLVEQCSLE